MSYYCIAHDNRIRCELKASEHSSFSTVEELEMLTQSWPLRRLVDLWNKLPGLAPLSRFENRAVAVRRIWHALQLGGAGGERKRKRTRTGRITKLEMVLRLLQRQEGASLKRLMKATGWQAHTVRGFLSRKFAKQADLTFDSVVLNGERVYCVRVTDLADTIV